MTTQNKQRPGCFFSYGEPKIMLLSGDGVAASSISLFYIEQLQTFPTVDYRCGVDYVEYDGREVTHNVLVWSYGFSDTASTVVDYDNDEPWSWYNLEMNLYWDIESNSWNASKPILVKDVVVYDMETHEVVDSIECNRVVFSSIPCVVAYNEFETAQFDIPCIAIEQGDFFVYESQEVL